MTLCRPDFVRQNVPLAGMTSMGVGGPARYLAEVDHASQLPPLWQWVQAEGLNVVVLGHGTNVIVGDGGVPGVVIRIRAADLQVLTQDADGVRLRAQAGLEMDALCAWTVERELSGLECLSGIPGTVGAAPVQNIGAYGQEVGDVVVSVDTFDGKTGQWACIPAASCEFKYRNSCFRRDDAPMIWSVTLHLHRDRAPCLHYPAVAQQLEDVPTPSLWDVRNTVLRLRREKGMVLDPDDPDSRSCGSFFVNPTLDRKAFDRLCDIAKGTPPHKILNGGAVRVPAAWLIESAGFTRGMIWGEVGISGKHCLALINRGNATALDILEAAEAVAREVERRFGVALVMEPRTVGVFSPIL